MTFHYAVPDTDGRYLQTGSCVDADGAPLGAVEVDGSIDPRHFRHDHTTGLPVALPIRPSPHHAFDHAAKDWRDTRTPESEWIVVRAARDALLAASDHTQLPDSPRDRQKWIGYRQALRDITKQGDPFSIEWPLAPSN